LGRRRQELASARLKLECEDQAWEAQVSRLDKEAQQGAEALEAELTEMLQKQALEADLLQRQVADLRRQAAAQNAADALSASTGAGAAAGASEEAALQALRERLQKADREVQDLQSERAGVHAANVKLKAALVAARGSGSTAEARGPQGGSPSPARPLPPVASIVETWQVQGGQQTFSRPDSRSSDGGCSPVCTGQDDQPTLPARIVPVGQTLLAPTAASAAGAAGQQPAGLLVGLLEASLTGAANATAAEAPAAAPPSPLGGGGQQQQQQGSATPSPRAAAQVGFAAAPSLVERALDQARGGSTGSASSQTLSTSEASPASGAAGQQQQQQQPSSVAPTLATPAAHRPGSTPQAGRTATGLLSPGSALLAAASAAALAASPASPPARGSAGTVHTWPSPCSQQR